MVKSSDCVPIIIYCKDINYIAIIHSGWKGVLQNIVGQVIDKLINLNAKCDNIYIAIGPCIAQESYEVKKDLFIKFIEKSEKNAEFFISINDKIYFSLYAKINEQILEKNIINSNIDYLNIDTFTSNNFTSYRKLSLNDSTSKCVPLNFISFVFLKDILDKSLNKE